jgi:dTDP-4-dehydrorhamnose 3,5-epimerase
MRVTATGLADVLILEPAVLGDIRGFFLESFNRRAFREATGLDLEFVQDNHSRSVRGVLRGLHYQLKQPQGKLVRVARGRVFDVAVDLRRSSPTFTHWQGVELSEHNQRQLWIPPGFAHGFLVLSESADVLYKTTAYYDPQDEHCMAWNDAQIGIEWPLQADPILSEKDHRGLALRQIPSFP